ncbi:MAG: TolC family protein, partial [Paludibacteraceae bacterium]|nr:TolC family protein [Paludibacteraceae bacterium]
MNKLSKRILIAAMAMLPLGLLAQAERRTLTLAEVIEMAQTESPDAVSARNTYKSAYWTYRNYRADNLPILSLG